MSEHWGPLERLLSEWTDPEANVPSLLVSAGHVRPEHQERVSELLAEHTHGWAESEYDSYCQCGKWLEYGYYQLEDHQADVLHDARLINGDTPQQTPPTNETC